MGSGLVKSAYLVADRLSIDHAPTRVYVYMATCALDDDAQPMFWRGRDELARALGKKGASGHRAAGRAIETLTAAGVIALNRRPAPGNRTARYSLLDGAGSPLRPLPNGGRSPSVVTYSQDDHRPVNGGRSAPQRRTVSNRSQDAQRPPEEYEEKEEPAAAQTHEHEPNAVASLTRLQRNLQLAMTIEELLAEAYRIGDGNPWHGYLSIQHATEQPITGARDPSAVLRKRLRDIAA